MGVLIYLGHGASGSIETIAPYVDRLRARGLDAHPLALPRGRAERAIQPLLAQLPPDGPIVVGGHSFGGRVSSLAVAGPLAGRAVGLVCLSYPLHRPGAPETWAERVAHWPRIGCPALLLSGESDPFARLPLLRDAVALLPNATLATYPGLGHGLKPVIDDVVDRIERFVRSPEPPAGG